MSRLRINHVRRVAGGFVPRGADRPLREVPPAYKSIRKVGRGGHFPAGGPGRCQRTNLYEQWPPETISRELAKLSMTKHGIAKHDIAVHMIA